MQKAKQLSDIINKFFTLFVLLIVLIALFLPKPGTVIATTKVGNLSAVSILLMIVLFGMAWALH
ncbi:Predicted Na+-dependent transporter YfeH (YfeH) [Fructobacillus evanidus]|uniref:Predicted Na+-dependent transporter YfeH (YfeH) n=1 Tax=Fructobacillus evanidus TaxID=3064281 RepID=A0ABN9YZV5_9LACO|nr:Predicted Na+-dependent transporter YfeH (YfeH) [Fructobacillus sp. LMG 32999]CAK1230197.1 Predicted Na+-dependent transporter YfeH (YfeH) [Fructobacillus sp. LMG 32999]CAK1230350.1 Predicted Na+-dependent transporter YfeH (YfeH) [Fructobacillus sp. LMG 32999]CAK1231421.1 Predicted Na+-dependent transporter YfeH (YfeH) [Fructobacillus sp. LMG 32999]CAK1240024.1 Predicted Na+-dependent transporter YfeH (YfeH) [Fructobacillus sp. LMG 32999]